MKRFRKVHVEVSSLDKCRLMLWAEPLVVSQVQQMEGVTRVEARASGGYYVFLDPRHELGWILEQLGCLARWEEEGGRRWLM
jgi:hypothetical protein